MFQLELVIKGFSVEERWSLGKRMKVCRIIKNVRERLVIAIFSYLPLTAENTQQGADCNRSPFRDSHDRRLTGGSSFRWHWRGLHVKIRNFATTFLRLKAGDEGFGITKLLNYGFQIRYTANISIEK